MPTHHASIPRLLPSLRAVLLCLLLTGPAMPLSLADPPARGDAADARPVVHPLIIRTQGGESWKAPIENVEAVLHSTAGELWRHFPGKKLDPIIVSPKGGPIVLFKRGPKREYYVHLNTGETYWAQYAYQFAHEMTHILAGYKEGDAANQWFEESICELASLYVLRRLAQTWKTDPPYDNWKSFAPSFAVYAKERMEPAKLAEGQTLAEWFKQHEATLRKEATKRELNQVAAVALLPLFEKEPEHWPAIGYLNEGDLTKEQGFAEHLRKWHAAAPQEHRVFIARIAGELGVKIE